MASVERRWGTKSQKNVLDKAKSEMYIISADKVLLSGSAKSLWIENCYILWEKNLMSGSTKSLWIEKIKTAPELKFCGQALTSLWIETMGLSYMG